MASSTVWDSNLQLRPRIELGDLVIIYEDWQNMHAVRVKAGGCFSGYYGKFAHDAMVGRRFGEKMGAQGGRGFVHLLSPSAELWTAALPHRTQILCARSAPRHASSSATPLARTPAPCPRPARAGTSPTSR
jgi:hypothetical protein